MFNDPTVWLSWIKVAAFISGILFGGLIITSVSWVWVRKNLLTVGACFLSSLGTAMIGMSIWKTIEIEGPGVGARFSELEAENQEIRAANNEMKVALASLQSNQEDAGRTRSEVETLKNLVAEIREDTKEIIDANAQLRFAETRSSLPITTGSPNWVAPSGQHRTVTSSLGGDLREFYGANWVVPVDKPLALNTLMDAFRWVQTKSGASNFNDDIGFRLKLPDDGNWNDKNSEQYKEVWQRVERLAAFLREAGTSFEITVDVSEETPSPVVLLQTII